jgi:hypothetical protein
MPRFIMEVNAHVTVLQTEIFTIEADTEEEAEALARENFKLRMWEKHGWADYDNELVEEIDREDEDDEL